MRKTWALVMAAAMAAASLTACSSSKPAETAAPETEAVDISGGLNQTENRSQYFGFLQLPEVTAFHGADSRVCYKVRSAHPWCKCPPSERRGWKYVLRHSNVLITG